MLPCSHCWAVTIYGSGRFIWGRLDRSSQFRRSEIFRGLYLILNAAGALASPSSHRDMLARTETVAESVRIDSLRRPTFTTIVDLPKNSNGVFFFGSELIQRIEKKIPQSCVVHEESPGVKGDGLIYQWRNAERRLVLSA